MEKRSPITYTFEDIKRYKQGLMSREEMHAFEKASMEDPFLADALEGYMEADMDLAEQHLGNIKQKIASQEGQNEKAVVVAMPQKRFNFMRVAAMVVVLIGAGLLTYKILDKKDIHSPEIAQNDQQTKTQSGEGQQASATVPVDSNKGHAVDKRTVADADGDKGTASLQPGAATEQPLAKAQVEESSVPTVSAIIKEDKSKVEPELKDKQAAGERVVKEDDRVAIADQNYNSRSRKTFVTRSNNQFRGRVLTPNNQPLANANIQLDNYKTPIITDELGNFELNARDTVVTATVASTGYMDTRVQLRSNSENTINIGNIVLQPDPAIENEIAVTGLGAAKTKRVADTLSTKPEGGWESFQQYVANKLDLKLDTTGSDMRMSGELELEFFVDANGNPKNFKVINSTNPSLNQQAIDAVQTGPKWATRKKKTRILIRY